MLQTKLVNLFVKDLLKLEKMPVDKVEEGEDSYGDYGKEYGMEEEDKFDDNLGFDYGEEENFGEI